MKNTIPKTAAIHGVTGFGRSSISVVIPVLSSMGIQVCPLPSAVLSSHPGGFDNYTFYELTNEMEHAIDCWKEENIKFDCIYSGFLGSAKQVELVKRLIENNDSKLIVIDPVMGDHGKLYKITDEDIKNGMLSLIEKAYVITPNLTEACLLAGKDYNDKPLDLQKVKHLLKKLSDLGPANVVITGIRISEGSYGNFGYSKEDDSYWKVNYTHIPAQYPGTGDIFASALTGYIVKGFDLPQAVSGASRFVSLAVEKTYMAKTPVREGILLENMLFELSNANNFGRGEIINE
ncbi:pyridoxamine kinase [Lutispora sp.]|jgi:pyridoxine kinase|uniref:pyridoxamine kinase n=1 Tax=Lutispora sp. TaxID=2828727 RepID=UPI0035642C90